MSGPVTTRVWRESTHTNTELLLLVKIADNVNNDAVGFAGNKYLANNVRKSVRQVQRLLDRLQDSGELYVQKGNGRGNESLSLITLGLDHDGIKNRLIDYFKMSPFNAENVTLSILEKKRIKGDILEQKRVTKNAIKGDISKSKNGALSPHDDKANGQSAATTTVLTENALTENALNTMSNSADANLTHDDPLGDEIDSPFRNRVPEKSEQVDPLPAKALEAPSKVPPKVSPPEPPKGFTWWASDYAPGHIHLRKNSKGRPLCKITPFSYPQDNAIKLVNLPPCEECLRVANKPKLPPQYGDLFGLVHKYAFGSLNDRANRGRAGDVTKALLENDPTTLVADFKRFAESWPAHLTFPCGTDTLPSNFTKWRANDVAAGAINQIAGSGVAAASGHPAVAGQDAPQNGAVPRSAHEGAKPDKPGPFAKMRSL